jgi:urea ABC transporter ATP-binding protein UrtD
MTASPLLRTQSLSRRFGGLLAVDDVSIDLARGEIHCIVGPNGAGKSTLLNMVCGTIAPSSGRILFEQRDIVGLTKRRIARLGIARKFQAPSVFGSLTVRQNLEVAADGPAGAGKVADIDDILRRIELTTVADKPASLLAHGQKQWLEVGMALATAPRLLLLDEPTAGMTTDETAKTAALVRLLRGEVTVLAIEHDMGFVRALACETIVMHQGRVIASGSFESIAANDVVRDVYLGRGSNA